MRRIYLTTVILLGFSTGLSYACLAAPLSGAASMPSLPSHPGHGKKCLHVDTPVQTGYGWSTVGNLTLGDLVLDKDGLLTPIVLLTNRDLRTVREFVRFRTASGHGLSVTSEHALFARPCHQSDDVWPLVAASRLTSDLCVLTADGRPDRVVELERFQSVGVALPVTESGSILAGGVAVSCYDSETDDDRFRELHQNFQPYRYFYELGERVFHLVSDKDAAVALFENVLENVGLHKIYYNDWSA